MDLGDVNSDTIARAQLADKAFEQFVRQLLVAERDARHQANAKIRGPVAAYRADNKRDLIFEVFDAPKLPRNEFTAALTWDQIGQVWYSCKGGGNWRKSFLDELGRHAAKQPTPPSKTVKRRPPGVLLDHLKHGRSFVFVVAEGTIGDEGFLDEMAQVLGWWLDLERGGRPSTLRDQLNFLDANDLADFINTHRPTNLTEDVRDALGVGMPSDFMGWQQWTDNLARQRDLPAFEADPQRAAILAGVADPTKRTLRVFGPPGAGKTRVVHEGIRRLGEDAQARVRYGESLDASYAIRSWLPRAGRVYLVLDELRTVDIDVLVEQFEANASPDARLFLIGTSDDGARVEPGRAFALGELDDDAIDRMVAHEFNQSGASPNDDQLETVRTLSENYPWYAVLLARALATEPARFDRGEDDASRWSFGARRVLADNPGRWSSPSEWESEAELRAKCLLVAMMTRDLELEWDEIWERHGPALTKVLDESNGAHDVKIRERVCRERQILRETGIRSRRRYVSPNNLARLILHHFFDGGPDLGPRLRRFAPEFRATVLTLAKAVHAKPAVIDKLALGEWDELARRATHEGIDAVAGYLSVRGASRLAAIEAPEAAARAASATLLGLDCQVLASAPIVRSVLRGVLSHVIHRVISAEAFLLVESALIHLARAEDEPWANSAIGVWRSLFLPGLHCTHQPWTLRLERLDTRLADDDVFTRGLAIDALGAAVEPREHGLGHADVDTRDGEWPCPTLGEFRDMKAQLWDRLLDACSDREGVLADRARRAVALRLRSGIGQGLSAPDLRRLTTLVASWTAAQRQALAESITDIRRYDLQELSVLPAELEALDALDLALAPTDILERLVAQVGTWDPGPWQIDDDERPAHERAGDRALALELLHTPGAHDQALEWLVSAQAERSGSFWHALGFVDEALSLRPAIISHVRAGATARVLANYLLGRAEAEGPQNIEAWIDQQPDAVELAPAFANFVVMQPPSLQRLERLHKWVASGVRADDALTLLAYRGWAAALDVPHMLAFVRALVTGPQPTQVPLLLLLRLLERESEAPQHDQILDLLHGALDTCVEQRVVIGQQHIFVKAALALATTGRFDSEVASLVIRTLDSSGDQSNAGVGHHLLKELLNQGHAGRIWPDLAAAMLDERWPLLAWQLAGAGLLAHLDPSVVLAWVGPDLRRAQVVAQLVNPHGPALDEVTRQLLIRFGPDGEVARTLAGRARSTPGVVAGGLAPFERRQQTHAHSWTQDEHPQVRSWAQRLEAEFRQRADEHDARAQFRRKYA